MMREISYLSDLVLEITFTGANGAAIAVPSYDFDLIYYVDSRRKVSCGKSQGQLYNCTLENGVLRAVFKNHGFNTGRLKFTHILHTVNASFPDGKCDIAREGSLPVMLVSRSADHSSEPIVSNVATTTGAASAPVQLYSNRSDIEVIVSFKDDEGEPISVPMYDFEFVYYTSSKKKVSAGSKNQQLFNCTIDANGKLHICLNAPELGPGYLHARHIMTLPDGQNIGSYRNDIREVTLPAKIVTESEGLSDAPVFDQVIIAEEDVYYDLLATEDNLFVTTEDGFLVNLFEQHGRN